MLKANELQTNIRKKSLYSVFNNKLVSLNSNIFNEYTQAFHYLKWRQIFQISEIFVHRNRKSGKRKIRKLINNDVDIFKHEAFFCKNSSANNIIDTDIKNFSNLQFNGIGSLSCSGFILTKCITGYT